MSYASENEYAICGDWVEMPLAGKLYGVPAKVLCLFDTKDLELLKKYKWSLSDKGYVLGKLKGSTTCKFAAMHRVVMDVQEGAIVDHISRNKVDNRRSNLRICTSSQNSMNTPAGARNTSGYKGVGRHVRQGKWQAYITAGGVSKHLGLFATKKEAAEAYNKAAKELHGEFAKLNILRDKKRCRTKAEGREGVPV